ncbi:hypothetical protein EEB18_012985 [Sphingopyxis sp. OPL5]|uniref:tetratricopeptide repeat protein n=1 Tax=Sphingopyxis sp. OPL5 TaxID=2486273 RepID=UPI00164E4D99|nr:hypothetical protein [Sphingopyxis sp. OPL5]QNO25708.1 hypothetical protein EEB18_012985 [Sphingopyxis sp. OPL5]
MRALLAALLLLAFAPPAHAEWQRIETAEFALQADMEPEALRALGVQLLDHDRLLRQILGVTGPGRGRRIEMIIYGDHAQLVAESGMPALAAGFFNANPMENFALLPARDTAEYSPYDATRTLRHEYTHYFMVRHLGRQYPGWFIEGLASFFETAHRGSDGIMRYGAPHEEASIILLKLGGLPFSRMGVMPDFRQGDEQIGRFYAQGWLITSHYFMGGPQAPGIKAYLETARRNGKPDPSLFAGGPAQLDRDVAAWFADGLPPEKQVTVAPADASTIQLRPLSPGEVGLIGLRLEMYRRGSQISQHRDATEATAALSRQALDLAKGNPDDRVVGRYVAKLFLLMDSDEVGSDDIAALLDPAGTTAEDRILQARLMTRRADEGPPAKFQQTVAASRATLQGVLKAEPDNVDALVAMFENVREAEGASSQAAQYLARALAIEPANSAWRMALLELYLRDNRKADVVALLQPIANMPHGGADTAMASDMIKRFAGVGPAQ